MQGKLYSLAYGRPCAMNVDPIEKKPLYHFLPGSKAFSIATAGCNFTCLNCQNYHISQVRPSSANDEVLPEDVVESCLATQCQSIAYTYTEPTVFYEYMFDIAHLAREAGIRNVMVSNGYINAGPLKKLIPLLDAANIDLKSLDDEVYRTLNGGSLKPVLNTLRILKEHGVWIEITHLIVSTYTDRLDNIKRLCEWLVSNGFAEFPIHFSRFFPTYKLGHLRPTPVEVLKQAREIALKAGCKYVYVGNIHDTDSNTYCPHCKKLVIERMGYWVGQMKVTDGKCPYCGASIAGVWS
jgi:pyruvate formate lyase activating enzyme